MQRDVKKHGDWGAGNVKKDFFGQFYESRAFVVNTDISSGFEQWALDPALEYVLHRTWYVLDETSDRFNMGTCAVF
jgi:hypothetical protein